MSRLKYTQRSLRDLNRLHNFLLEKSPKAARLAIQAIRKGLNLLNQHPEIGRPVADLTVALREWVIEFGNGAYIVLYRIEGMDVVVLAIRHGREAGY
jgi:plasmid stabilization system protein ParE